MDVNAASDTAGVKSAATHRKRSTQEILKKPRPKLAQRRRSIGPLNPRSRAAALSAAAASPTTTGTGTRCYRTMEPARAGAASPISAEPTSPCPSSSSEPHSFDSTPCYFMSIVK